MGYPIVMLFMGMLLRPAANSYARRGNYRMARFARGLGRFIVGMCLITITIHLVTGAWRVITNWPF